MVFFTLFVLIKLVLIIEMYCYWCSKYQTTEKVSSIEFFRFVYVSYVFSFYIEQILEICGKFSQNILHETSKLLIINGLSCVNPLQINKKKNINAIKTRQKTLEHFDMFIFLIRILFNGYVFLVFAFNCIIVLGAVPIKCSETSILNP